MPRKQTILIESTIDKGIERVEGLEEEETVVPQWDEGSLIIFVLNFFLVYVLK